MISYRVGFVFNKLYFILLLLFCILKAYSRSLAHNILKSWATLFDQLTCLNIKRTSSPLYQNTDNHREILKRFMEKENACAFA